MEFDLPTTVAVFVTIVAVSAGALLAADVMPVEVVLAMVLPSMVVFGLICVGLGVLLGQHRNEELL